MCGIAGILTFAEGERVDPDVLRRMRDSMSHRGPDGSGSWVAPDGRIGLAHRRLSIIDLSPKAAQPMSNEDGSIWVSFNGEIYNYAEIRKELEHLGGHTWKTDHSDTEVIIHAFEQWGIDCIHRFRGMFAIAIWDGRSRELWLVRDRIGIKPLYYSVASDRVVFASEIKAIHHCRTPKPTIDEDGLFFYLSFLTVPAPRTLFRGISKLAPATWLRIRQDGDVLERRYWDVLDHADLLAGVSDGEIAERLLAELRTSVRLRCVSDVPVGAFLSGGIDSSTNLALLAENGSSVNTFTVGFRGQSTYRNETAEAARVARAFHAEHHEQLLGVDDLMEFLPRMVYEQDEPIADPVCVPIHYLSALARKSGVIVCQVGEGADELFGGYPRWRTLRVLQALGDLPVPQRLKRGGLALLERAGRSGGRPYEFLRRSQAGFPVFWGSAEAFTGVEKGTIFSEPLKRRLNGVSEWDAVAPTFSRFQERAKDTSTLAWMTYADLNLRLPELLLMRVDKMSMGEGVECRVPFLDHRFVELAVSIPASVKTPRGMPKHILKRAVRGLIPDEVIDRPKQGFGVPVAEWILKDLGVHARSAIDEMVRRTDLFDREAIRAVLDTGKGSRIWFLLNLSLWWKRFVD